MWPAAHLPSDTPEGAEVEDTTVSVEVTHTDLADAVIMMAAETPMDLSALHLPEDCPRDASSSPSPSTSNVSLEGSATKQVAATLIQDLYSLVTIEDTGSLTTFLPGLEAAHKELTILLDYCEDSSILEKVTHIVCNT